MANIERLKKAPEAEQDIDTPELLREDNKRMNMLSEMSDWMEMLDEKDPNKTAKLLTSTEQLDADRLDFIQEVANGETTS